MSRALTYFSLLAPLELGVGGDPVIPPLVSPRCLCNSVPAELNRAEIEAQNTKKSFSGLFFRF